MSEEKALCFTGHRPSKLEQIQWTEDELRFQLHQQILQAFSEGFTVFYCGMAAGVDIMAGELVAALRQQFPEIRLIGVIPHPKQSAGWPLYWQLRWKALCKKADKLIILFPRYQKGCYYQRNQYMVNHAHRVIAVYDGTPGGTHYTIAYARKKGIPVKIIRPKRER